MAGSTPTHGRLTDVVAVLCALYLLAVCVGCGPKAYPSSRPKYGEPTQPVGPPKELYKSQPKFKP